MNMEDTKIEEGFKRCSKCGRILPITEFHKDKSRKDGLQCWCKACIRACQAEWSTNHKEKIAEYMSEYYAKNKEAIAQKQAEYRQANKDAILKQQAEYRQSHREEERKRSAEYRDPQKNQLGYAKYMVNAYRWMDKERGFDTNQTISAEWFLQNIAYKPCAHCGKQGIGLIGCNRLDNSKGHTEDNVEAACFKCNCKDNIRDQLERGIHTSQLRKKQSFKDFVNEHKAKDKNLT